MKEKEWRGFAVQSVVLLVVVLILSVFHPGDIIRENGTKVMADGTAAAENNKKHKKKEALQEEADLFISIHCNSSEKGDGRAYGVETLYSKRKPVNSRLGNRKLSQIMLDSVAEEVDNKKRGVIRREGLYIMHHSDVPASIIEIGYMSNKSDLKYILSKNGRKKVAKGIYKGIMEALG